ncbi:hypothetical protein K505DRAFT_323065 [Melanomma pulvis-pyrius CBS 109.77]|uniref:Uncharacterized protein n=1 Tax=Melanomma pulvis-pyrius CBS 109.77 TaxID=1314802 RepID=A0A6A6XJU6_9PLEO|nr:hypothetical protein K505DRAFT_323065 [Melanomma pulvis-pyrius CBS 109.77]
MDSQRASSRASRRSYPNLHNLSLAPLSAKYPLDASQPPSPSEDAVTTPRTSYIAQKSAPTTPGILSLSQSRSSSRNGRRRSKAPAYAYDGYFHNPDAPVRDAGDIPKAKSTTALLPCVSFADQPHERHHKRKNTTPIPLRLPLVRHHTSDANDEWLHRAGLAIAGETREFKGQSWLVRRESSTSLVLQTDEYEEHPSHDGRHMALLSGEHLGDVDFSTFTPRHSRAGSRIQSRVGSRVVSARTSRRGSRVGSKIDLMMSAASKTPSARHSLEMDESLFAEDVIEPDFVDDNEESDGDEEEVARLARERGFGLGGWMDRLIGWTLFSVDEDGEDSDEEEEEDEYDDDRKPENMTKEELQLRREVEAKRRKLERETIIAASAVTPHGTREADTGDEAGSSVLQRPPNDDNGGWQDAAWLFSVATKVLL